MFGFFFFVLFYFPSLLGSALALSCLTLADKFSVLLSVDRLGEQDIKSHHARIFP